MRPTVSTRAADVPAPDPDGLQACRDHNLARINEYRATAGVPPLVADREMDAFALAASEQYSRDRKPHQYLKDHGGRGYAENQGFAAGSPIDPADVIGSCKRAVDVTLEVQMSEGPGGGHHDSIVTPKSTKLGSGLYIVGDRVWFTNDFLWYAPAPARAPTPRITMTPADPKFAASIQHAVTRLNEIRAKAGVPPVRSDDKLTAYSGAASTQLAKDHVLNGYWRTAKFPGGAHYQTQGATDGYDLGGPFTTAFVDRATDGVFDFLLTLDDHRGHLTNPAYKRIGVGLAVIDGRLYVTIDLSD